MKKTIAIMIVLSIITGCSNLPKPEIYNYTMNSKTKDNELRKIENQDYEKIYIFNNHGKIIKIEKLSKKYNSIELCKNELEIDVMNVKKRIKEKSDGFTNFNDKRNRNIIEVEKEIKEKYEIITSEKEINKNFELKYNLINLENNKDCYYSIGIKSINTYKDTFGYKSKLISYGMLAIVLAIPLIPVTLAVSIIAIPVKLIIILVQ